MGDVTEMKDIFSWSARFETGLHEVDQQHARLVQLINELARISAGRSDPTRLLGLLDELQDYTGYHFRTEEDLMAKYALEPEATAAHIHAHESLREQVRIVREVAETAGLQAGVAIGRLLPFLTKWLIFHVLGTDMRMAQEVLARQRGESAETAHQLSIAGQTESLVIVLDALNDLNDNLTRRSSELTEAYQRLRISEARYAMAQRAARIGSWELDLDQLEMNWSDEVEPLFGFRLRDLSNRYEAFMACVHPDDRERISSHLEAVRSGTSLYELEHRVVWPDGSVHWLANTAECVRGEPGEALRLVGIVRDITEERAAQQQLRDTNQQLTLSLGALERHAADLTRLNELNESLQSCLNSSEAFEVVEHVLARLKIGSGGALSVLDAGNSELRTVARWGDGGHIAAHFACTSCWGMRRGQRHAVRLADEGPLCKHFEGSPPGATLCLPLRVLGDTLGLLSMHAPAECSETEWARINHLASMVAETLKLALSNVRLREALHEQATRDPLTGLLNRRYLDEALPRELARAAREHRKLAVVMLDLDHFKQVNDSWGHEAGDAVLAQLAITLRGHLRSSDLACRFGGEEFVVVMPGASLEEARERMEVVARSVRETPIHLAHATLPPVRFSAGLAEAFKHGSTAEELLRAADIALYAAKEAGRDCLREALPPE
ncbi:MULTISPECIES: bacteriohemerythrin [unclassified Uliginosibacterium]|uniref:bacteriohemerythrin n=1 Tax=unclassified Uliginosibacterium TaxID=2621521 RepID=UPI001304312F|nr:MULTISPECIES: bacteriohemerythrin [unclassified Uliginosibacterium]MDO6387188.1 bacteriohemerythrin [Uliginosibacterium sp. 31-12]